MVRFRVGVPVRLRGVKPVGEVFVREPSMTRLRVTPEQRATAPTSSELGGVSSGSVAPQVQRATTTAAAGADSVPPRTLRQGFRDQIQERLDRWRLEREKAKREAEQVDSEIRSLKKRKEEAFKKKDSSEMAALQSRIEEAEERRRGIPKSNEWPEITRFENQLRGTEQNYFEVLTGNAAGRPDYIAVRNRGVDEVFGIPGDLQVEHVFPRSKIFLVEGFEKLSYDDQIAIFNFGPNLRAMSADANSLRRATPYRELKGVLRSLYPDRLAAMAIVEAEMETMISRMIANGPYRREQLARVARGEVPLLPNGNPITIQTLTPVGTR